MPLGVKYKKYREKGEIIMSEQDKKCNCKEEDCKCEDTCVCDEECDCGCQDDDIVELTTDDGKKLKFFFIGTIEYQGKNYSAFEPAEEIDGLSEDDLVIFELAGDDEETAELLPVEDEAILDAVFEEFCRVLDEEEMAEEAELLEMDKKDCKCGCKKK